ncbi:MAG TPA: 50S ribosomal protein L32 [Patescibacteria group bacterium]|nr:50S ribosomal protein L32 [Patescibacteria group bacterium]
MPPLPKRKFSHGRKKRRYFNKIVKAVATVKCRHCGAQKLPHRVCPECGKM